MGDEGIAAVADAGPLIQLYEIGRLDIAKSHLRGLIDLAEAEVALGGLDDTGSLFVARALIAGLESKALALDGQDQG